MEHQQQQANGVLVMGQVALPRAAVHVGQGDTGFLTTNEEIVFAVVAIKHAFKQLQRKLCVFSGFQELVNRLQRFIDLGFHALQCQPE